MCHLWGHSQFGGIMRPKAYCEDWPKLKPNQCTPSAHLCLSQSCKLLVWQDVALLRTYNHDDKVSNLED